MEENYNLNNDKILRGNNFFIVVMGNKENANVT